MFDIPLDQDISINYCSTGRSLDIPFNETAEEEKKKVQGRSIDVPPNGDVFQTESKSLFLEISSRVLLFFLDLLVFMSVFHTACL